MSRADHTPDTEPSTLSLIRSVIEKFFGNAANAILAVTVAFASTYFLGPYAPAWVVLAVSAVGIICIVRWSNPLGIESINQETAAFCQTAENEAAKIIHLLRTDAAKPALLDVAAEVEKGPGISYLERYQLSSAEKIIKHFAEIGLANNGLMKSYRRATLIESCMVVLGGISQSLAAGLLTNEQKQELGGYAWVIGSATVFSLGFMGGAISTNIANKQLSSRRAAATAVMGALHEIRIRLLDRKLADQEKTIAYLRRGTTASERPEERRDSSTALATRNTDDHALPETVPTIGRSPASHDSPAASVVAVSVSQLPTNNSINIGIPEGASLVIHVNPSTSAPAPVTASKRKSDEPEEAVRAASSLRV